MRLELNLTTRKGRQFTAEFKTDAVNQVRTSGQRIAPGGKKFGSDGDSPPWVGRRIDIEAGEGLPVALTQAEYEELVRLRRENKRLQMERNSGVVLQYHQKRTDPR